MFKKFLMVLLCLLSISILSSCDMGVDKVELKDFDYEIQAQGVVVLNKYYGNSTKIKVKSTYDSNVTMITEETFAFNEDLEEVILSVSRIPNNAFEGCKNLKKVTLKMGISSIGDYAFKGCENLEEFKINGEADYISSTAFYGCPKLSVLNATGIHDDFNDEKKTLIYQRYEQQIVIGTNNVSSKMTAVGDYAFYGRDAIKNLVIPASITEIGKMSFAGCPNLERITVDRTSTTYDSRDNCNAIIEKNSDKLIVGCKNTSIPNDVQTIGEYAFADCIGLKGVNIPTSIKKIEDKAFLGSKDIETITVSANNVIYDSRDNANAIIETSSNRLLLACNQTVIPSDIEVIAANAYSNVTLTSLVIPEGVKTIEDYAFENMDSLESITLPASLTSIGVNAFAGCTNLKEIKVVDGNSKYDSRDNCNAIVESDTNKIVIACNQTTISSTIVTIGESSFANLKGLTEINIPDNVQRIEKAAFLGCENVVNVLISDGVKTIGEEAFCGLKLVDTLKLPNSVQEIGNKAFAGWESLINIIVDATNPIYYALNGAAVVEKATKTLVVGCTSTVINDEITTIKQNAFYGSKLKRIVIPASVTTIEAGAFAGCKYLVDVTVASTNPIYEDRGINAIVEKETSRIVVGCKATLIDKSIKIIGERSFEGSGLFYIDLDLLATKNVNKIESYAFADCQSLYSIEIGKSIKVIESHAFKDCYNIDKIDFGFKTKYPEGFAEDWNSSNVRTTIS